MSAAGEHRTGMWDPRPRHWWLLRTACVFCAVYLLGLAGVPTLVPYVTAVILVLGDGARVARRRLDR